MSKHPESKLPLYTEPTPFSIPGFRAEKRVGSSTIIVFLEETGEQVAYCEFSSNGAVFLHSSFGPERIFGLTHCTSAESAVREVYKKFGLLLPGGIQP